MTGHAFDPSAPICHHRASASVLGMMVLETGLVGRARAGDLAAFEALVGPLIEPASQLARALLRDWHEAEDAVQEATFKAWRAVGRLQESTASPRAWFLTIVANEARSRRRGRWWRVVRLAEPRSDSARPGPEEDVTLSVDLERAMGRLREVDRLILLMHFYLDLPHDEVGRVLGLSTQAVKSRMYRATRGMRPTLRCQEGH